MIRTAELAVCTAQLVSISLQLSSFLKSSISWKPHIFNWAESPLMTLKRLLIAPAQNQDQCLCSSSVDRSLFLSYLKVLPAVPATPPPLLRNRTNSSQPSWLSILHSETNPSEPSWLSIFNSETNPSQPFQFPISPLWNRQIFSTPSWRWRCCWNR